MKRVELDCPHPQCKALHPFRLSPQENYQSLVWCRCEAIKVRVSVKAGEVQLKEAT